MLLVYTQQLDIPFKSLTNRKGNSLSTARFTFVYLGKCAFIHSRRAHHGLRMPTQYCLCMHVEVAAHTRRSCRTRLGKTAPILGANMPDDEERTQTAEPGKMAKLSQHWKEFAEATPEEHKK